MNTRDQWSTVLNRYKKRALNSLAAASMNLILEAKAYQIRYKLRLFLLFHLEIQLKTMFTNNSSLMKHSWIIIECWSRLLRIKWKAAADRIYYLKNKEIILISKEVRGICLLINYLINFQWEIKVKKKRKMSLAHD